MIAAMIAYTLCAITSVTCAVLLLRSWKRTSSKLLFWSSLCFIGLAIDNGLMFLDLVVIPQVSIPNMSIYRNLFSLAGICSLIYGLIEMGDWQ